MWQIIPTEKKKTYLSIFIGSIIFQIHIHKKAINESKEDFDFDWVKKLSLKIVSLCLKLECYHAVMLIC